MSLKPILLEKLNNGVSTEPQLNLTRRDGRLPDIPGKAHAVIGMRRAGKTSFLRQLQAERRLKVPPERAIFLAFDDERLADLEFDQLGLLIEAYYRRFPELRGRETVHWFFDEIQLVTGWERFVRRILDTERVEIVVSGSSARMLSREVHTSLRGRGMETVIRPFSFREFLRHRGLVPNSPPEYWSSSERSVIEKWFYEYLSQGGFPEAQGLSKELRIELLQGYVDTVLFRDVVERYGITQVAALRWLTRHCLRSPAGALSVHRLYNDLRSQGYGIAKDAVHALFGHLLDAFLISAVPIDTESERRRNSNPRKIYPVDPGFIQAFDTSGRSNTGHALETIVLNELERRKALIGYVKTEEGFEVDFHAVYRSGAEELLQVCSDPSAPGTMDRELRGLIIASESCPQAVRRLLVLTRDQATSPPAPGISIQPVYEWILAGEGKG